MERAASAAPRLADVVRRAGYGAGKSVGHAVHAAAAGKFARGDRAAGKQSIPTPAAEVRARGGLRLSLQQPGRKRKDRRMVGAAGRGSLLSTDSSRIVTVLICSGVVWLAFQPGEEQWQRLLDLNRRLMKFSRVSIFRASECWLPASRPD